VKTGTLFGYKVDYYDILIRFGETFKTALLTIKYENLTDEFNNPNLKMIPYHYLELAEKIDDRRIKSLAIEIGELY
jgi:hypothetical protein